MSETVEYQATKKINRYFQGISLWNLKCSVRMKVERGHGLVGAVTENHCALSLMLFLWEQNSSLLKTKKKKKKLEHLNLESRCWGWSPTAKHRGLHSEEEIAVCQGKIDLLCFWWQNHFNIWNGYKFGAFFRFGG